MPEANPIIPSTDITSGVSKTLSYLQATPIDAQFAQVEGSKPLGVLCLEARFPDNFPLDKQNPNEVVAFVHALHAADSTLAVTRVTYDAQGKPTFIIQTRNYIGDNPNHTIADETAEVAPHAADYQARIAHALNVIARKDAVTLEREINQSITREQQRLNTAYSAVRHATEDAYATRKDVVVFADQLTDQHFPFHFLAAVDGATARTKLDAINIGIADASKKFFRENPDSMPYADVVNRALSLEKECVTVNGITNHHPDRKEWGSLTNHAKNIIEKPVHTANYADFITLAKAQEGKRTLSLMTDYTFFPPGAAVINAAPDVTGLRRDYYVDRYSDDGSTALYSPQGVEKTLQNMHDKNPYITIPRDNEVTLYYTVEMGRTMYAQAKMAYMSEGMAVNKYPYQQADGQEKTPKSTSPGKPQQVELQR